MPEKEANKKWRYKNPNYQKEWREKNKETLVKKKKEYADLHKEQSKNAHLKRLYGITIEEYKALEQKQNGVCAICGKPPKNKKLFVDHDHKDGTVRGLLCGNCNFGVGYFYEDTDLLHKTINYLKSYIKGT